MKKSYEDTLEELLWRAGLAVLFCTAAVAFLVWKDILDLGRFSHPCLLRTLFGCYCPGCGGTRAVITLAHGEVFRALYDNFAAPMTAAWAPIYMASQTVWSLRKEPGWDLHYDSRWLRI